MVYCVRWGRGRAKFGNKRQEYNGLHYDSKKEGGYAFELDLRVKAKDIKAWTRQVRIPLDVDGKHVCNYYIDFVIEHNDGTVEYVEVKGFETDVWKLKWRLFEILFSNKPGVKLTVIK